MLGATESVLHVGEPSEAVLSGSGELYRILRFTSKFR